MFPYLTNPFDLFQCPLRIKSTNMFRKVQKDIDVITDDIKGDHRRNKIKARGFVYIRGFKHISFYTK